MTIKQFLDKYFEDYVEYNQDKFIYVEQGFWNSWDKLEQDIDLGGIQWALEWYLDAPALSNARETFIKNAISKYIKNNLKPVYTNQL